MASDPVGDEGGTFFDSEPDYSAFFTGVYSLPEGGDEFEDLVLGGGGEGISLRLCVNIYNICVVWVSNLTLIVSHR